MENRREPYAMAVLCQGEGNRAGPLLQLVGRFPRCRQGDTERQATSSEAMNLRSAMRDLHEIVADLTLLHRRAQGQGLGEAREGWPPLTVDVRSFEREKLRAAYGATALSARSPARPIRGGVEVLNLRMSVLERDDLKPLRLQV